MKNPFKDYRDSYFIKDRSKNPMVEAGDYSYYAGYHHGKDFDDCVWYLDEKDLKKDVDRLIIGKFCAIAAGATFIMGGNQGHKHNWFTAYPLEIIAASFDGYEESYPAGYEKKGDTVIENDVWIGAEAIIMPGVHIGNGAVIATRAVVTRDVEPYTVVGGNPAKVLKKRFDDETAKLLEKIKWWNLEPEKIMKYREILAGNNIDALRKIAGEI